MSIGYEPDRDTRADEQQALEEIRRLFARYRQTARHGIVTEHDEPATAQADDTEQAPSLPAR
jgi:hypothetical protein